MRQVRLHLVRHGESLANEADKARRPRPDDWDALSERGWEQARGLGRRLEGEGIEVIVASPQFLNKRVRADLTTDAKE